MGDGVLRPSSVRILNHLAMKKFNPETFKKLGLSLAIVIVMNVFFNVGIDTFYDAPDYNDFCSYDEEMRVPMTKDSCDEVGGLWFASEEGTAYCEGYDNAKGYYDECQEGWDQARSDYNRIAFVILTALGTLVIIFALFVGMPAAVMHGLLFGGVLSLLIGTMRYWSDMDDYLQFIVSGVALVLLVGVGIKKLKD